MPKCGDRILETRPSHSRDPDQATYRAADDAGAFGRHRHALPNAPSYPHSGCVDGLEQADVAAILGCPEGTVSWRVHEARRKLNEYLALRGFGGET